MIKITTYRVRYVPTEDGDRDVLSTYESTTECETLEDAARYLRDAGTTEPSVWPAWGGPGTWYFDPDGYESPYEAWREETSSHPEPSTRELFALVTRKA